MVLKRPASLVSLRLSNIDVVNVVCGEHFCKIPKPLDPRNSATCIVLYFKVGMLYTLKIIKMTDHGRKFQGQCHLGTQDLYRKPGAVRFLLVHRFFH